MITRLSILPLWIAVGAALVSPIRAQTPSSVQTASAFTAPPSAATATGDNDRFAALRENADRLKAAYDKLDTDNVAEIDQLLRTRRCQSNRVGGLVDRTLDALRAWSEAELQYWKLWGEVEQVRVDGQQKSLAGMEADQKHAEDLVATTQKDREEMLRQKAVLEKYGKRTEEIRKQFDALIQDIQESEQRLAEAQKNYDEVTTKVRNMRASISARLVDIRESRSRIEAFALQLTSFYETKRATAQEICNTIQPDTKKTVLSPKNRGGQSPQ
jgi:chromosome segregation ATPase